MTPLSLRWWGARLRNPSLPPQVATPVLGASSMTTTDPLARVTDDLRKRVEAKWAKAAQELTQPEERYVIFRVAWDEKEKAAGFRLYSQERILQRSPGEEYAEYSRGMAGYMYGSRPEGPSADEYLRALSREDITRTFRRELTPFLFPSREVAEDWLVAFLEGPDTTSYGANGGRIVG